MNKDFEQYKQEAKDRLLKAIEEQDKLIKAKEEMVKELQTDFDKIARFQPGNFIVNEYVSGEPTYYLIVGTPIIKAGKIKIPMRHHISPVFHPNYISLHMSGVIDMAVAPLDKMDKIKIITIQEYFELQKPKIKDEFDKSIPAYEISIEDCKEKIKKLENEIKYYEGRIKEYKSIDFDSKYPGYVEAFLKTDTYNYWVFENNKSDYCDSSKYNINLNV